jgi:redox-sensitive bicupin YhaK (pirin superfamily)
MTMKRKIGIVTQGRSALRGNQKINHLLPNRHVNAVGPFVFFEELLPTRYAHHEPFPFTIGSGAQPHRGIATLTYILKGEAEHFDSAGNHDKVSSGGIHWTKTGNGIIQDEVLTADSGTNDLVTHAFKFWINLPSVEKAALPDYLPFGAAEVPKQILNHDAGWLSIIAGEYSNQVSTIPAFTKQFLFHIHLNSRKDLSINTNPEWSYAAFLAGDKTTVNDAEFKPGDFLLFENGPGLIEMAAHTHAPGDIILFGGEPIAESIVVYGPFVMNSMEEIALAYGDFHEGKYGRINYRL